MAQLSINNIFNGKATITIKFSNRVMWQRYRKYILKTDWEFDGGLYPDVASVEMEFHNTRDVAKITQEIVWLLQLGFNVNTTKWELKCNEGQEDEVQFDKMISLEDLFKLDYEERPPQLEQTINQI